MEYVITVLFLVALIFVFRYEKRRSYDEGYKAGATKILNEWKEFIGMGDGPKDDE